MGPQSCLLVYIFFRTLLSPPLSLLLPLLSLISLYLFAFIYSAKYIVRIERSLAL